MLNNIHIMKLKVYPKDTDVHLLGSQKYFRGHWPVSEEIIVS